MFKHILVPLDGSALAETALEPAKQLVAADGSITLLMVVPPADIPIYDYYPVPLAVVRDYETSMHEAVPFTREYLERVAQPISESLHIQVNVRVEIGDPANTIVEVAKQLKPDAIVMSTHGRSGITRWLFGSVTQKVLAAATCPILVIPNFRSVETVGVSTAEVSV
jgi:nucleotide-binding universal stress UspA family protein